MAGVAGLEPVTSAVTGQRSNQLSYTPAKGRGTLKDPAPIVNRDLNRIENRWFGQQTPRRWGWRTPLKKRSATRTERNVEKWPTLVNRRRREFIHIFAGSSRKAQFSA